MEILEIKILGQTFQINVKSDKVDFYREMASGLDRMLSDESRRQSSKSDIKTVLRVAFLLFSENNTLKDNIKLMENIVTDIEDNLNSILKK